MLKENGVRNGAMISHRKGAVACVRAGLSQVTSHVSTMSCDGVSLTYQAAFHNHRFRPVSLPCHRHRQQFLFAADVGPATPMLSNLIRHSVPI